MVTHVLTGTSAADLPAAPMVTVELVLHGAAAGRLEADTDGARPQVIRRPGVVVLPRVVGRTVVRLVPPAGTAVFPSPTLVSLTVSVSAGGDADHVLLQRVDASGLEDKPLIAIAPVGGHLQITALDTDPEDRLSDLATLARAAARNRLHVHAVPADSAPDVVVALDASASMTRPLRDGLVEAVLDLVVGLGQVVIPDRRVRVVLLTDPVQWLPTSPPEDLPGAGAEALARSAAHGNGLRWTRAGLQPPGPHPVVFHVTDGLPADLHGQGGVDAGTQGHHLVSLVPASAWDLVRAPAGLPQTLLEEVPGPAEVDAVVRSLLVGVFPTGSEQAARVGE